MTSPERSGGSTPGLGVQLLAIGLFVALGVPLVFVLWGALNHLLAGELGAIRPLVTVGALAAFAILVAALARVLQGWR